MENNRCVKSVRLEVILVRIFPTFSRIQTEYGEIRSISQYSVQTRKNARKMRIRITPNTDSFYAVSTDVLKHIQKID